MMVRNILIQLCKSGTYKIFQIVRGMQCVFQEIGEI